MKEIRLSVEDYDGMRKEIQLLSDKVKEHELEFQNSRPEVLRQQAVNLAMSLTNKYLNAIFKKLGFEQHGPGMVYFRHIKKLGDNWYDRENFTAEISLVLMKELRQSCIDLGVAAETLPEIEDESSKTEQPGTGDEAQSQTTKSALHASAAYLLDEMVGEPATNPQPDVCGDCAYFKLDYQYNPDAADGSGPGRCYILQVPHPRHKHDPACCQLIPQSKGEVCGFCDGEKWINEDVLTKPCPSCGGTGIKHK